MYKIYTWVTFLRCELEYVEYAISKQEEYSKHSHVLPVLKSKRDALTVMLQCSEWYTDDDECEDKLWDRIANNTYDTAHEMLEYMKIFKNMPRPKLGVPV